MKPNRGGARSTEAKQDTSAPGRRWIRTAAHVARPVLAVLGQALPPGCAVCARGVDGGHAPLCGVCESRLPSVNPPLCPRCGATRFGPFGPEGGCPECQDWPEALGRAGAPYRHEGSAAALVRGLKYRGWTALAARMGLLMQRAAFRVAGDVLPALVPVPLAPPRQRERGYNQADLLAAGLSVATGWPVVRLLRRDRSGPSQVLLGRRARRRVRHLFRVERSAPKNDVPLDVLIVDDVITTGATAAACAEALLVAGHRPLGVVAFARALPRIEGP